MRVAVKQLEGVQAIEVSLNRGLAAIRLEPDNRLTIARLRETIRAKGFTPKAAEVRVRGTVVAREATYLLALPGDSAAFRLVPHGEAAEVGAALARLRGAEVSIVGVVPESARETASPLLEVRSVAAASP